MGAKQEPRGPTQPTHRNRYEEKVASGLWRDACIVVSFVWKGSLWKGRCLSFLQALPNCPSANRKRISRLDTKIAFAKRNRGRRILFVKCRRFVCQLFFGAYKETYSHSCCSLLVIHSRTIPNSASIFISTIAIMSYKSGITAAIAELKDRSGSSMISIKKYMQSNLPADKKWMNTQFLNALKTLVAAGTLVQTKVGTSAPF
jgi:linker histone H1 and H5 family